MRIFNQMINTNVAGLKRNVRRLTCKAVLTGVLCMSPFMLHAATIIVNYGEYFPDPSPGDGICDFDLQTAGAQCSIQTALHEIEGLVSNGDPGPHRVEIPFSVPPYNNGTHLVFPNMRINGDIEIVGTGAASPVLIPMNPLLQPNMRSVFVIEDFLGTSTINATFKNLIFELEFADVPAIKVDYANSHISVQDTVFRVGDSPNEMGLQIETGTVECNRCYFAGGKTRAIEVFSTLTLTDSEIHNNIATSSGGAIFMTGDNADVTVLRTKISNNFSGESGGGIYSSGGNLQIISSSIMKNSANDGGGLALESLGTTIIRNSTITENNAGADGNGGSGGGIRQVGAASVLMSNSILSGNYSISGPSGHECSTNSEIDTTGPNVIGIDSACTPTVVTGPAAIRQDEPLSTIVSAGPWGGFRIYKIPNLWHPATDGGANASCAANDQRNGPRPLDGDRNGSLVCDMGAFELNCSATGDGGDEDGDGIAGLCDNCPDVANRNQLDSDGDGQGDACEGTSSLSVLLAGLGQVASAPGGISCGSDCTETFLNGTAITLFAQAVPGNQFVEWTGDCTGNNPSCSLTLESNSQVTAVFAPQEYTLSVERQGSSAASGHITSVPSGIDCPGTCSQSLIGGTQVALSANTISDQVAFAGWSGGGCSGTGTCLVTVDQAKTVTALFEPGVRIFVNSKTDNQPAAGGTVTSSPAGIVCTTENVCSITVLTGTEVALTASAAPGSWLAYWGSCPSVNGNICTIQADTNVSIQATFTQIHPLTVTFAGNGSGLAWNLNTGFGPSEGETLNCPGTCSVSYYHGGYSSVKVTPDPNSEFVEFSGDCSGNESNQCLVHMDQPREVTVNFEATAYELEVVFAGSGSGEVDSSPGWINDCRPNSGRCINNPDKDLVLTLKAKADANNTFVGWSGGTCSGTEDCEVTINQDLVVTARFEINAELIHRDSFE